MDSQGRASFSLALARLAGGDRSAQRPVFDAAWPVLRDFCRKLLSTPADAEDCAQRALIRLFEQVSGYDVERDGLAWALEIALWECRTVLKKRARSQDEKLSPAALEVADGQPGPEALALRAELDAALSAALKTLNDTDRAALLDGLTGATWRKRRERALGRLKLWWRTQHDD